MTHKRWTTPEDDDADDAAAEAFLRALCAGACAREADERVIVCGFRGDPDSVDKTAWRPRPWRPGLEMPLAARRHNAYVTVAAFGRAPDGSFRRRVDTFRAGLALMVDDVGTKVPRSAVEAVPPSARFETSPGNEQWWYLLREPERDLPRFDALIRAFIAGRLLGEDPGMSGVNRVGRLPGFVNGKAKHGGWIVRARETALDRRYAPSELVARFGLRLMGRRYDAAPARGSEELRERARAFGVFAAQMRAAGMFKRDDFDPSGWLEVRCPWVGAHTAQADTGAAIRRPAEDNGWHGAFRCHHGHCADRGWGDLTDWLAAESERELREAEQRGTPEQ